MELKELFSVASSHDEIIILIRGNPDPDAIASAFGLTLLLEEYNDNISIAYTGEFTRPTNSMLVEILGIPVEKVTNKTLDDDKGLFMVDGQPTFLRQPIEREFDVVIDHHPVTEEFSAKYRDIRTDYGATSTIITEYFREAEKPLNKKIATALFYGIKTDTRNLSRNVCEADIEAFRFLYNKVDHEIIKKIESESIPLSVLNYFSLAIASKQVIGDTIFSFMGSPENPDVTVYVADLFMQVAEADWAIVACRSDDEIIITFRYTGRTENAGQLASELFSPYGSAGGHESMARAEIKFEDIKSEVAELEDKLIEEWIFNKLSKRLKQMKE
jgi:nanoRNase/pAp phosphatase (c-di-AMP/oligoRNAs hydrolase)